MEGMPVQNTVTAGQKQIYSDLPLYMLAADGIDGSGNASANSPANGDQQSRYERYQQCQRFMREGMWYTFFRYATGLAALASFTGPKKKQEGIGNFLGLLALLWYGRSNRKHGYYRRAYEAADCREILRHPLSKPAAASQPTKEGRRESDYSSSRSEPLALAPFPTGGRNLQMSEALERGGVAALAMIAAFMLFSALPTAATAGILPFGQTSTTMDTGNLEML